ncbi:MAG: ankyrin repeat domain-containing protein [Terriglobales bacterium]
MTNTDRCFDLLGKNDFDALSRLLESDPACAGARDKNGVSLLMHSLYRGRRDIAELLAVQKKTLDIFEAAALGRLDPLRDLIRESPAALNSHSADGFTALHFACFFGQPEAARVLIDAGGAVDAVAANPMALMPLHSAASARNLEAARLLLQHRAPVNARQHGGWVPLHAAAANGDRAMVELLLQHHADPNLANDEGKTAAMVAKDKGHNQIAFLLEA